MTYSDACKSAAHDLEMLSRLLDKGRIQDMEALQAICTLADDLKTKVLNEATHIYSHPVLFAS